MHALKISKYKYPYWLLEQLDDPNTLNVYWWSKNNPKNWYEKPGNGPENFGDILGPYIAERFSEKKVVFCPLDAPTSNKFYIIIGSILSRTRINSTIWGAGIIHKKARVHHGDFYAVRGVRSRNRLLELGFDVPEVYGDPALLMPLIYRPNHEKRYRLGVIPHYVHYPELSHLKNDKIRVINLYDPIEKVIDAITSCDITVSTSLHGWIVSHAYRIPAAWGILEEGRSLVGDNIKFYDYQSALGEYNIGPINLSKALKDVDALVNTVLETPQPKISAIRNCQQNLLKNCPFISDKMKSKAFQWTLTNSSNEDY